MNPLFRLPLQLSLHPLRIPNPKTMLINLSDPLQRHIMHLRITKHRKHPAKCTHPRIEPKRPTRRHPLHHRQESRRDDDVACPAGHGVQHRSQSSDFEGQELRPDPGDGRDAGGVEGDVDDYEDEEEDGGPVHAVSFLGFEFGGQGDVVKGDRDDDEGDCLLSVSMHHWKIGEAEGCTIPIRVIKRTVRRPNLSITPKLTKPNRKFVAPTTIDTTVGLLNPTMENNVPE